MNSPGDFQQFVNIANQYLERAAEPAEELDRRTNEQGDSDAPEEAQAKVREALKHFRTAYSSSDINTMFPAVYDARECLREAQNIVREVHPDNPREVEFDGEYDPDLDRTIDILDGRLMSVEQAIQPVYDSGQF
jgi:hypothetical protein